MNFLHLLRLLTVMVIFMVMLLLSYNKAHAETSVSANDGKLVYGTMSLGKLPSAISAASSQSGIISYKMPSVTGAQITATAMIFIPKTPLPANGFPLIIFGHDNGGIVSNCSPSIQIMQTGRWRYDKQIANLLKAGIVVIVPDYEGMGVLQLGVPASGHPFLNKRSLANSMIYAVVAAKHLLGNKLSGDWLAFGNFIGANAALATAEYSSLATQANKSLHYKGTIAVSPLINITATLSNNWKNIKEEYSDHDYEGLRSTLSNDNALITLIIHSLVISGYKIDPAMLFTPAMFSIYSHDVKLCFYDLSNAIYESTNNWSANDYPGFRYDMAINDTKFNQALRDYDLVPTKLPGKTLILQGGNDIYNNPRLTINYVNEMLGNSSDILFSYYPKADHFGVLSIPTAQKAMGNLINELLFNKSNN